MGRETHSSSSSIDSSSHSSPSLSLPIQSNNKSSGSGGRLDLTTDLRLGLSISPSSYNDFSSATASPRQQPLNWPPIRSILKGAHAGKSHDLQERRPSLFVKIYMEGIPIGRKLNLFEQDDYDGLIRTIGHMFPTTIIYSSVDRVHSDKYHVLTYEDKEGDWMMVGDVPWEMFLNNVKRLKVTRADRC